MLDKINKKDFKLLRVKIYNYRRFMFEIHYANNI